MACQAMAWTFRDILDQSSRTFVVTGANSLTGAPKEARVAEGALEEMWQDCYGANYEFLLTHNRLDFVALRHNSSMVLEIHRY